jgi:hypothetical protein
MAKPETIMKMFELFTSIWPNRETNASTATIYHLVLQDIDDDDLLKAGIACIESCKFWPSPSEIRERTESGSVMNGEKALALATGEKLVRDLPEVIQTTLKNIGGKQMLIERDFVHMRRNFLSAYADISKDQIKQSSRERAEKLLPRIRDQGKLIEGSND